MNRNTCTAFAGILVVCFLCMSAQARNAAKIDRDLAAAVAAKNAVRVRALLSEGANPNAPQLYGVSLLMIAADNEDAADIALLLAHDAAVNARDDKRETALHHAALYGLSSYDRDDFVSQGDVSRRCAILGVLRLFIAHHADMNAADKAGETPLMLMAGYARSPACVRLLLRSGANAGIRDKNGRSALDYAQAGAVGDNAEVIALLRNAPAAQRR